MSTDAQPEAQPEAQSPADYRLFEGRGAFHDALRETLQAAAVQGCRELVFSDADFADWPIGERAVVDLLTQWAGSHRSLTLVAIHYDAVLARHARFVQWRRQWSHVVHAHAFDEIEAGDWPTVLLASDLRCVRLFDRVRYRGAISGAAADLLAARESVDAILQRSVDAFPATTLGL